MNENQMLKDFREKFITFRENFHNIGNNIMDFEMNNGLYDFQENASNRISELKEMIEKETENLKNAGDEDYNVERSTSLIQGYNDQIKAIEAEKKEFNKQYKEDINKYQEELRSVIGDMKDALNIRVIKGKEVSSLEIIKVELNSRLTVIEYELANLVNELKDAKGLENRSKIASKLEALRKERAEITELLGEFDNFIKVFKDIENRFLKKKGYLNAFDLEKYSNTFESIAEVVNRNVDNSLISINIIKNENGTYSLDMRCGNKIVEPRPLISEGDLNQTIINDYLKSFANNLSLKTDLKYEDLIASNVAVKYNGSEIDKIPFKEVGDRAYNFVKSTSEVKENQEQVEKTQENNEVTPTNTELTNPTELNNSTELTENQPKNDGLGKEKVQESDLPPGNFGTPNEGNENIENNENKENQQQVATSPVVYAYGRELTENDKKALKAQASRVARNNRLNKASSALAIAAVGLGLAGPALGMGVAMGAVAGGAFLASKVYSGGVKLVENIKYGAMKHRINSVVNKFNKAYNTDLEVLYDDNLHRVDIVHYDPEDVKKENPAYITTDGLNATYLEGHGDDLQEMFNEKFEKYNKTHGNGDYAEGLNEYAYKNLPKVSLDDLTAAFADFGGYKSRKELNSNISTVAEYIESQEIADKTKVNGEAEVEEVSMDEINALEGTPVTPSVDSPSVDAEVKEENGFDINASIDALNSQITNLNDPEEVSEKLTVYLDQLGDTVSAEDKNALIEHYNQNTPFNAEQEALIHGPNIIEPEEVQEVTPDAPVVPEVSTDVDPEVAEALSALGNDIPVVTEGPVVVDAPVVNAFEEVPVDTEIKIEEAPVVADTSEIDQVMSELDDTPVNAPVSDIALGEDRHYTDEELKAMYDNIANIYQTQGEVAAGEELGKFFGNENITVNDYNKLQEYDLNKEFFTDAAKNEKFNVGRLML